MGLIYLHGIDKELCIHRTEGNILISRQRCLANAIENSRRGKENNHALPLRQIPTDWLNGRALSRVIFPRELPRTLNTTDGGLNGTIISRRIFAR